MRVQIDVIHIVDNDMRTMIFSDLKKFMDWINEYNKIFCHGPNITWISIKTFNK